MDDNPLSPETETSAPKSNVDVTRALIDRIWRRLTADFVSVICRDHLQCETARELLNCLESGHAYAMSVFESPEQSVFDDWEVVDLAVEAFVHKVRDKFWEMELKAGA